MPVTLTPTSRSFRLMWDLVCDAFPPEHEFTYEFHVKPLAEHKMAEYKAKTRVIAWQEVHTYAIRTGQMKRISKSAYAWMPPVE